MVRFLSARLLSLALLRTLARDVALRPVGRRRTRCGHDKAAPAVGKTESPNLGASSVVRGPTNTKRI